MMDASASKKSNADPNQLYGFFLLQEPSFPTSIKSKSNIIKYTKLPDFDFDSQQVSWPQQSNTLQPRLRRIICLGDDVDVISSRSLDPEILTLQKIVNSNFTKRKIVTISEDDENIHHPRFSKHLKVSNAVKTSNRSIETNIENKVRTSRQSSPTKSTKEIKSSAKMNNAYNIQKKDVSVQKLTHKGKPSNISNISMERNKGRNIKEKDTNWSKNVNAPRKISVSKKIVSPSESDKEINIKRITSKKTIEKIQPSKLPPQSKMVLKEITAKKKTIPVIYVPLDEKYHKQNESLYILDDLEKVTKSIDCSTETEEILNLKNVNIGTEPLPIAVDQTTQMDHLNIETVCKSLESVDTQTEILKETYDSLEIPNVTLIKDKSEVGDLKDPPMKTTSSTEANKENVYGDGGYCRSASYVMRRAILTYTTRQKIDLHVFDSEDKVNSNQLSSPLSYPMNVVSVFKAEMNNKETQGITQNKDKSNVQYTNCSNEQQSLNCSYVFNSDKLMKPSDIIKTISGSSGLLQGDYICEQFQKELNFIDSFFESLQYLESCCLSDKCLRDSKHDDYAGEDVFDEKNPDYSTLFSKFEDGANIYDTDTMASKSLCVLNLLIRDEQRRAKNLLFVLKMREDALKDFTKSQILWLEKKKKQDNTDISTLKKKQRGALLKLQHECGEMQRMRKALLTLSEKRKVALIKTKMNIELKLNHNVEVEKNFLGKRKLKRSTCSDRNTAPVKCFDLSSSGCEESSTSRSTAEGVLLAPTLPPTIVTSAEKSIQTGDSILGTILHDQATDTAAENFVAVDGGYLNILFHNLSLPQIFSSTKQYEVNEEALKNIVMSSNTHNSNLNESDVVERLMDQIKNCDLDSSSSASTARSMIDEYDQYYRNLDEKCNDPNPDKSEDIKETPQELEVDKDCDSVVTLNEENMIEESPVEQVLSNVVCVNEDKEPIVATSQVGPLPVPAGAADTTEKPPDVSNVWLISKPAASLADSESTASSTLLCPSASSMTTLSSLVHSPVHSPVPSPVNSEAEELRRQQLAIEREIKALEQQQCQHLVVREIPDKPPPPYTPPTESRVQKPPRPFQVDEEVELKVHKYISGSSTDTFDLDDPFDMFIKDYCQESVEKQKLESCSPWDAFLIHTIDGQKSLSSASEELKEVLAGVPSAAMTGVGSRRSDHIDDILFTEWRRCEPEWTSLHTDEAIVKNQIFDSIFQKVLTETIDEYKKTVKCKSDIE